LGVSSEKCVKERFSAVESDNIRLVQHCRAISAMAELLIARVVTAATSVLQINDILKIKCLFSQIYNANVPFRVLVKKLVESRFYDNLTELTTISIGLPLDSLRRY